MSANVKHRNGSLVMVRRLLRYLWPHWGLITTILLTVMLLSGVNVGLPLLVKAIINQAYVSQNGYLLVWLLAAVAGVYLARNGLFYVSRYWSLQIAEGLAFDLRRNLFEHIQGLGLEFYRKYKPGKLSSRLMGDVAGIQEFFRDTLGTMGADALTTLFLLVVMFLTNWQLALASTFILPLQLLAYYRMRTRMKLTSQTAAEQLSVVHGDLVESFSAPEVIKSFGQEDREAAVFRKSMEQTKATQMTQRIFHVLQKITADLLIGLGYLIVLGYTGWMVIAEKISWSQFTGTFMMFWMCLGLAYASMAGIINAAAKFQECLASLERVYAILDVSPPPRDPQPLKRVPNILGQIEFCNVCYRYAHTGKPFLQNISFHVPAGQTLVIVGPSGSGKSTLVNLLLRMFDPTSGTILIDGIDYRHIPLAELRQNIGVAFQDCFLFNRSILENIRYARPEATQEEIEAAAKKANAHDFICRLKQGYHTVVGEGGVELSRGEKQRITLTRAILKEPKILILDEATASVDLESERAILKAIQPIMQNRTTLLITHRQEIISNAKHLLHMGQGLIPDSALSVC